MRNVSSVRNANEVREQLLSYLGKHKITGLEQFQRAAFIKVLNDLQFDKDTTIPFDNDVTYNLDEVDISIHTAKMVVSLIHMLRFNSIGYNKDTEVDVPSILREIASNIVGNSTTYNEQTIRNNNIVQYIFSDKEAVIRKVILELEFYDDNFVKIKTLEMYSRNYNVNYNYTIETPILYSLINVFVRKVITQELKILRDELLKFDDKEKYHENLQ